MLCGRKARHCYKEFIRFLWRVCVTSLKFQTILFSELSGNTIYTGQDFYLFFNRFCPMLIKMSSVTFFLICCLFFFPEFVSSLECSSNSQEADYEPFPRNVTPTEFHTRMEITLSHRNATYFVNERYDAAKERGAFTLLAEEYDWGTYYDKSENEIANLYLPILEDEEEKLNLYINACKSFAW